MTDERLSNLILTQLQQINSKLDETVLKIAKLEVIYENLAKTSDDLEEELVEEVSGIEKALEKIDSRLKSLEEYRASLHSRIVVLGSTVAFIFTILWGFLNKFVFPIFFT